MVGPEFASCWLKIGRAEEHFNTYKTELQAWNDSNPYSVSCKPDAEFSRHSIAIEVSKNPPFDRWSLIAGDCVHNLRSALDHLIYALAIRETGGARPESFRSLQFPIAESPGAFEKQRRRIAALSTKAQTAIERAQPYNRSHQNLPPLLSVLSEFDNSDKHRMLNFTGTHAVGGKIDFITPLLGVSPDINWRKSAAIESGTEVGFFILDPPKADVSYKCEVLFAITVTHVPGPTGIDVSVLDHLLGGLIEEVKRTVVDAV